MSIKNENHTAVIQQRAAVTLSASVFLIYDLAGCLGGLSSFGQLGGRPPSDPGRAGRASLPLILVPRPSPFAASDHRAKNQVDHKPVSKVRQVEGGGIRGDDGSGEALTAEAALLAVALALAVTAALAAAAAAGAVGGTDRSC